MIKDTLKELKKLKKISSSRAKNTSSFKNINLSFNNNSFLSRVRNSLIIFFIVIVIFKLISYIAGIYLSGNAFASFIAYFSFFSFVVFGLIISIYFPAKYGGSSSFEMPKIRKLGEKKNTKEQELEKILKNERKNSLKLSKENETSEKKLKESNQKIAKLESKNKELIKQNKEIEKTKSLSVSNGKFDLSSIFDSMRPRKKEVVQKEKEVNVEMPKIKLSSEQKKLLSKFKKLPKQNEQRIAIYRQIARNIQKSDGSFTLSQIMEVLIELFRSEVDNDRGKFLKEIEEWVNEDAYTPLIRTEKGIRYHRIIK